MCIYILYIYIYIIYIYIIQVFNCKVFSEGFNIRESYVNVDIIILRCCYLYAMQNVFIFDMLTAVAITLALGYQMMYFFKCRIK